MLIVTLAARQCLLARLARKKAADDVAMRFTRGENGWQLGPDRASPDDVTFTHDGRKVLLIDEAASKAMANMTLDAKKNGRRPGLKLSRTARREG